MGSRIDRAAALRRFASHVGAECEKVQAGLARLRLELHAADLDAEDRAALEHEFESAAGVLSGTIDGAFETQRGRLFALSDALEALEYAAGAPASSSTGGASLSPTARGGTTGGNRVDPPRPVWGRRDPSPRWLRFADGNSSGVPYIHTWSAGNFDGVGAPTGLSSFHRVQEGANACAVVAQIAVLESITGEWVSESDAAKRAEAMGVYAPARGTPAPALGALLASYGVEVDRRENCDIEGIADALARGDRVMVPLNASEIWDPQRTTEGSVLRQIPPAGHAVWVTGLDEQNGQWTVILNDSGRPDGAMFAVSLEDFSQAWGEFDNLAVFARARSTYNAD